jgi:hypothetical protein
MIYSKKSMDVLTQKLDSNLHSTMYTMCNDAQTLISTNIIRENRN